MLKDYSLGYRPEIESYDTAIDERLKREPITGRELRAQNDLTPKQLIILGAVVFLVVVGLLFALQYAVGCAGDLCGVNY